MTAFCIFVLLYFSCHLSLTNLFKTALSLCPAPTPPKTLSVPTRHYYFREYTDTTALTLTLPKPHYPSKIAITLASLVKGRWIDGKAQTVDLLRLLAVYPPFYTTSFSAVKTEGLSRNPRLYQPFQNRTILRKALYPCPPSKKGVRFCCSVKPSQLWW